MIFPSTLITGTNVEPLVDSILHKLGHLSSTNNPDVYLQTDYTINSIRQLGLFLSRQPYSHTSKVIIISQAEQLHLEAQSALLKILEEPGDNNYLILTTLQPQKLLPTIVSRCHHLRTDNPYTTTKSDSLTLSSPLPTDKNEVINLLRHELEILHQQLTTTPSSTLSQQLGKLLKAISMVESNVDPRAAVDFYLLSL